MRLYLEITKEILAFLLRLTLIPLFIREFIQKNKVTIILYHKIGPSLFREHIKFLTKHYSIIGLQSFIKFKNSNKFNKLSSKSLIITFDDGYKSNYKLISTLKEFKIPITIFVCTDIICTNHHYLSKQEIIELLKVGVDLQSHTLTHPILPMCNNGKATHEIRNSKTHLEKKFNISVNTISYPHGKYCQRDIALIKKTGYDAAITINPGFNDEQTNNYKLKRIIVGDRDGINLLTIRMTVWPFIKNIMRIVCRR